MKIADIRDANMFQTLVHRLMLAERGADFHIPDDSGGDRGNDGYDPAKESFTPFIALRSPIRLTTDARR
ncbi:MAG: hypothetical protein ACR2HJ_05295 [Fimbriimonadales bacterium]